MCWHSLIASFPQKEHFKYRKKVGGFYTKFLSGSLSYKLKFCAAFNYATVKWSVGLGHLLENHWTDYDDYACELCTEPYLWMA